MKPVSKNNQKEGVLPLNATNPSKDVLNNELFKTQDSTQPENSTRKSESGKSPVFKKSSKNRAVLIPVATRATDNVPMLLDTYIKNLPIVYDSYPFRKGK